MCEQNDLILVIICISEKPHSFEDTSRPIDKKLWLATKTKVSLIFSNLEGHFHKI